MPSYTLPYLGASLLIALLGFNRTMGFWGYFFASLVLTPLMGLLLLLVSGSKSKPKKTDEKST
jgi:predicted PurR-regulated permease PerM